MSQKHIYIIQAYDKDADNWDTLCDLTPFDVDLSTAEDILQFFATLIREEKIKTKSGQPYDWVELYQDNIRIQYA